MLRTPVFAIATALCLGGPVRACETALLLAIDISGSIDEGEYLLQMQGLAEALADPDIIEALVTDQVSLAMVQWSGVGKQSLTLPWQAMRSAADVASFAACTRALPRAFTASDTAVGDALRFSIRQFADVAACKRHVIDISGDGPENVGFTVSQARAEAEAQGITINAIAIEDAGRAAPITAFYRRWAITKGGFVVTARRLQDYPRAIHDKLLRELAKLAS